jgi:hypothetical protein
MTIELTGFDQDGFPIPEPIPEPTKYGIWDVIDPCAFLCYTIQTNLLPLDPQIKATLDAFGWLNPDGFPDYDKMNREFTNHQ